MPISIRHDPFPVRDPYHGIYAHGVETRLVAVRKEMLDGVRPAVTTLFVSGLVAPAWLVEIEEVACAE
jgi:enamine deaminase RidA (YjgF/YER057c/UK114 family)